MTLSKKERARRLAARRSKRYRDRKAQPKEPGKPRQPG